MTNDNVFNCQCCGVCCRGEGGIYLDVDAVAEPAAILGLSTEEFTDRFTEPKYGRLALKIDEDGYCLLHDRQKHICSIHTSKPPMCRDWPFFYGILHGRQAFEDAKDACPGIRSDASWEEFIECHQARVGSEPPKSYISEENNSDYR